MDESSTTPERRRFRFEGLTHDSTTNGRCSVGVSLEWCGQVHTGSSEGLETLQGKIRSAAEATLEAVSEAAGHSMKLEVIGVKAVRAFDGWVVITSLHAEASGRSYRLLGSASCEADEELLRAAVISVLDAGNRVLERYVKTE